MSNILTTKFTQNTPDLKLISSATERDTKPRKMAMDSYDLRITESASGGGTERPLYNQNEQRTMQQSELTSETMPLQSQRFIE